MTSLPGLRVLLVEDEAVVRMLVEDMLEEFGCVVAASAATLAEAVVLAQAGGFDLAVLDVNLAGERVFPVADLLAARAAPFVFVTGYGAAGLRDDFKTRPVVAKPFGVRELRDGMMSALGA